MHGTLKQESIEWHKEDHAFLRSYNLAPPLHPTPSASCLSKFPVELPDGTGGQGVREEQNHTTARIPSPLKLIQYSHIETKNVKRNLPLPP